MLRRFGTLLSLVLISVMSAVAQPRDPLRLDPATVPTIGSTPYDFVPAGWTVIDSLYGDLDRRGADDLVLNLVEDLPAEIDGVPNDRARALVVLVRGGDGAWRRAAVGADLLYCTLCAGTLSDWSGAGAELEIDRHVLTVTQYSGSRWMTTVTQRFRLDTASGRMLMIGEDVATTDRLEGGGESTSTNHLTGDVITETWRYDAKRARDVTLKKRKKKVGRRTIRMEEVNNGAE